MKLNSVMPAPRLNQTSKAKIAWTENKNKYDHLSISVEQKKNIEDLENFLSTLFSEKELENINVLLSSFINEFFDKKIDASNTLKSFFLGENKFNLLSKILEKIDNKEINIKNLSMIRSFIHLFKIGYKKTDDVNKFKEAALSKLKILKNSGVKALVIDYIQELLSENENCLFVGDKLVFISKADSGALTGFSVKSYPEGSVKEEGEFVYKNGTYLIIRGFREKTNQDGLVFYEKGSFENGVLVDGEKKIGEVSFNGRFLNGQFVEGRINNKKLNTIKEGVFNKRQLITGTKTYFAKDEKKKKILKIENKQCIEIILFKKNGSVKLCSDFKKSIRNGKVVFSFKEGVGSINLEDKLDKDLSIFNTHLKIKDSQKTKWFKRKNGHSDLSNSPHEIHGENARFVESYNKKPSLIINYQTHVISGIVQRNKEASDVKPLDSDVKIVLKLKFQDQDQAFSCELSPELVVKLPLLRTFAEYQNELDEFPLPIRLEDFMQFLEYILLEPTFEKKSLVEQLQIYKVSEYFNVKLEAGATEINNNLHTKIKRNLENSVSELSPGDIKKLHDVFDSEVFRGLWHRFDSVWKSFESKQLLQQLPQESLPTSILKEQANDKNNGLQATLDKFKTETDINKLEPLSEKLIMYIKSGVRLSIDPDSFLNNLINYKQQISEDTDELSLKKIDMLRIILKCIQTQKTRTSDMLEQENSGLLNLIKMGKNIYPDHLKIFSVDLETNMYVSPLAYALKYSNPPKRMQYLKILLENGASINAKLKTGSEKNKTPMQYACDKFDSLTTDEIELLKTHGFRPSIFDKNSKDVLTKAIKNKDGNMLRYIKSLHEKKLIDITDYPEILPELFLENKTYFHEFIQIFISKKPITLNDSGIPRCLDVFMQNKEIPFQQKYNLVIKFLRKNHGLEGGSVLSVFKSKEMQQNFCRNLKEILISNLSKSETLGFIIQLANSENELFEKVLLMNKESLFKKILRLDKAHFKNQMAILEKANLQILKKDRDIKHPALFLVQQFFKPETLKPFFPNLSVEEFKNFSQKLKELNEKFLSAHLDMNKLYSHKLFEFSYFGVGKKNKRCNYIMSFITHLKRQINNQSDLFGVLVGIEYVLRENRGDVNKVLLKIAKHPNSVRSLSQSSFIKAQADFIVKLVNGDSFEFSQYLTQLSQIMGICNESVFPAVGRLSFNSVFSKMVGLFGLSGHIRNNTGHVSKSLKLLKILLKMH